MLGLIVSKKEIKELEYMIKRELEEILLDVEDSRIDHIVKRSMEERYDILYKLYMRVAPPMECMKYIRNKKKWVSKKS
ncbi:hypothetical protein EJF36_00895 [Bacillus sp. HMF5848]|uniref:hypothetical protein n=1 Tax=Bacillus sp. HMF5848 TaxID=2495421 RepID=UPI000F7AD723|nr:hypothetical protein [Bacillus sp. HMF5848]RSK25589.1 hypothetical protein EJF36_00895 [Bacillus sp. HMF5848]